MTSVMRTVPILLTTILGVIPGGCTLTGVSDLPARLNSLPGADESLFDRLQKAREAVLKDETAAALQLVEEILEKNPRHVNSHRLRQDILRRRGRIGLVLSEAEKRLANRPGSASAHYLMGRVEETTEAKQAAFRRALGHDRENFWGWYGLAFTLIREDNARASEIYSYLWAQSNHHMRVGVAFAQSLRRGARAGDASRIYHEIRRAHPGIGSAGMAETLVRSGKRYRAWAYLVAALRDRSFDGAVRGLVAEVLDRGLRDDEVQHLLDVLRTDAERMRYFTKGSPGLLAQLFRRVGEPQAALRVLRSSPRLLAAERHAYRRLLISCDGVAAFLRDLEDGAIQPLLDDEGNQVRGLWKALLSGPWIRATDPLAEPSGSLALTRSLMEVGFLGFADLVASKALLRHGDAASSLRPLHDEIRKEIAFESGLRRILTSGYARFRGDGSSITLRQTMDKLRELSLQTIGRDVVGKPKLFELPFVGTLVDSLGPGLPAHLAKYNKHLVMGQRNARPVEGMILTRLSRRHVDPLPDVPLPLRTVEVIGEHRELEPFEQGDVAGIALLNHYVVDMDEVRAWAATVAARRRISKEDGDVLMADPIPEGVAPRTPAGVEWRLSVLSPVEDKDLEIAVLDIIRWHEQGHMVDFGHLLPVEWHPLRAIALTVRNGFSALAVASEMEARAELTALAMSPHTQLVAAHIAGFLTGDSGQSPHARGFRALVDDILDELRKRDVPKSDVRHWHRVDPHTLRDVARHLLKRLW